MNIETRVYQLLNNDSELISIMNTIRGNPISDKENGIWKHDIPSVFRKAEYAPFIRINPVFEADFGYTDDESMSEEQRVQISFWTKNDTHSYLMKERMDRLLKENDFTRYTANENPRYKDTDIDLLINHRKYRFFDWEN